MPSILFIDYHFPSPEDVESRTVRLLESLPAADYRPLVVAGPMIAGDGKLNGTVVRHVDGNGNWIRAAVDAVDGLAARSAALLAVLTQPDSAFVAAELSARWDVPWIADVSDASGLARAADGDAQGAAGGSLRSILGSASAFTLRTPAAVSQLRRALPELGLKDIACVPERLDTAHSASGVVPCALGDVLDRVVPRRLRNGNGRHLRVVSSVG